MVPSSSPLHSTMILASWLAFGSWSVDARVSCPATNEGWNQVVEEYIKCIGRENYIWQTQQQQEDKFTVERVEKECCIMARIQKCPCESTYSPEEAKEWFEKLKMNTGAEARSHSRKKQQADSLLTILRLNDRFSPVSLKVDRVRRRTLSDCCGLNRGSLKKAYDRCIINGTFLEIHNHGNGLSPEVCMRKYRVDITGQPIDTNHFNPSKQAAKGANKNGSGSWLLLIMGAIILILIIALVTAVIVFLIIKPEDPEEGTEEPEHSVSSTKRGTTTFKKS